MKKNKGTSNKVLEIDLSKERVRKTYISEKDRKLFLGGKGMGLKLLYERLKPGINPYSEDNILIFMMGVFMGTGAPCSGRFAGLTKSPLTGIITSSSCGGPFGMALKKAGYDGLIIEGKLKQPGIVKISSDKIEFKYRKDIWGMTVSETKKELNLQKNEGALIVGPAGENMVSFANIVSGDRYFGRGGMGSVMGSKNLKALIASGENIKIIPENRKLFNKIKKRANKFINSNRMTGRLYREYGTLTNINLSNKGRILPVKNFTEGEHSLAYRVSGEKMKEKYNTVPSTCIPCSILCGHKGKYPDGKFHKIPEYETTALFGPNLGIFDTEKITEWNDLCGNLGLDTISTANTLGFVMEATKKGLVKSELKFGSTANISKTIKNIAYKKREGKELGKGTKWLSEKYGGKEFAIQVKGMEVAAYDPRGSWGQGLSYAVANRGGCHLSATQFPLEVYFKFLNPFTTRAKARFTYYFENMNCAVNSLHTCLFTSFAYILEEFIPKYTPGFLLGFFMQNIPNIALNFIRVPKYYKMWQAITGIKISQKDFLKAGERAHVLERYMNNREGISREDDVLPKRFTKESRKNDAFERKVPLDKMLEKYYKIRGLDNNGIPKTKTLKKLDLHNLIFGHQRKVYNEVEPGKKRFKTLSSKILLFVLGKGYQSASKVDMSIRKEIEKWPKNFNFMMKIDPDGPNISFKKMNNNTVKYMGSKIKEKEIDLIIFFKNIESAFMVLTAQLGTAEATCQHKIGVKGSLPITMSFIRCLNIVETYLFPKFIVKRILRRVPKISFFKKQKNRLFIYLIGIPFL